MVVSTASPDPTVTKAVKVKGFAISNTPVDINMPITVVIIEAANKTFWELFFNSFKFTFLNVFGSGCGNNIF